MPFFVCWYISHNVSLCCSLCLCDESSYPKDADKMLLARQTGLSRNQVGFVGFKECFSFTSFILVQKDGTTKVVKCPAPWNLNLSGKQLVHQCSSSAMETDGRGDVSGRNKRS
jgi:hypothetical protein